MKTFRFLSVIVMSLLMTSAFAQQGQGQGQGQRQMRTPEERAKTQIDWMKTDLSLDQATQTKVYDVLVKYAKKSSEERQKAQQAGAGVDREAMRAAMTKINEEQDKELKAILGDKTFELYKKKAAERRPQQPPRQQ